jgi:peptidoglycan hydrolase-like protein with peptidoglycan-binding domain
MRYRQILPAALAGAIVLASGSSALAAPATTPAQSLKIKAKTPLQAGRKHVSVPNVKVVLRGSLDPFAAGDRVLVKASRKGRRVKQKVKMLAGKVGETSWFTLGLKLKKRGKYLISAQRLGGDGKPAGKVARAHVYVVRPHAGGGQSGVAVRAMQHRLKQLGYIVNVSGRYNGTTGRAVLAFRKVNRLARNETANRAVFRKLAKGGGAFKLRYPKAGKHVEFDWSRQVVVLARGDQPVMTIGTSSGSPVTPTAFGKFRFWLKQAGYNQKQMYYSTYFHNGQAIHGFSSVPNQPASHGCLRIPIANAIRVYNWLDFGDVIYSYR